MNSQHGNDLVCRDSTQCHAPGFDKRTYDGGATTPDVWDVEEDHGEALDAEAERPALVARLPCLVKYGLRRSDRAIALMSPHLRSVRGGGSSDPAQ